MTEGVASVERRRLKLCAMVCLWMLLTIVFFPSGEAAAQPAVSMSTVVGFGGYYKRDDWVPVRLTLHNRGQAVQAQLRVDVHFSVGPQRLADGVLRWDVRLPAATSVDKLIAVPGEAVSEGAVVECFVNGQVIAAAKLTGTPLGQVTLVAALSAQPQAAQFLTGATDGPGGNPVLPLSVRPGTLPAGPDLMSGLTAVVVTPDVLARLTEDEANTLANWVKMGGVLMVTGAGHAGARWDTWLPLAPGPAAPLNGAELAALLGDAVSPPAGVTGARATLRAGAEIWAGTPAMPLVATRTVGRGILVQTSFSPLQPGLATWSGNAALWTTILGRANAHGRAFPNFFNPSQALSLASASTSLSPLRIPSLGFWAMVFALYALCIGPLVFVALRRRKREPWAWLILPALSVITTVAIYGVGASQRPAGVLTEGVGVLDLAGDGDGHAYGIRAFMSPQVISARLVTPQPMLAMPLAEQNVRQIGDAVVDYGQRAVSDMRDIGRWGVRYLYTAGMVHDQGELVLALTASQGNLSGSVHNGTPYNLHGVAVCWNGRLYPVGDLKPGQTAYLPGTVISPNGGGGYLSAYAAYNRDLSRGIGRTLVNYASTAGLLNDSNSVDQALVVATVTAADGPQLPALPPLRTAQRVVSDQTLMLVRQLADVAVYPAAEVTPI
ncbi:hypothetical protein [Alicyclobacillus macrosporangiidus]|uniref:Uncharacterized protein n=1 Tax=Alicyclobacillus macrosporangiidus TaxID=392015 RepID=A0A1I7KA42_9BACL|nr:hypothetical protein [Alicyclobacillus macrosporangiidus]SFU94314.1 hypothetical protein SAMN05421543_114113 [Alicyclobacillus macrosporangiidus]